MEKNPPGKIVFCQITLPTFRGGKREREIGTAFANNSTITEQNLLPENKEKIVLYQLKLQYENMLKNQKLRQFIPKCTGCERY